MHPKGGVQSPCRFMNDPHVISHLQLVDVLRTRNNKPPMFQSSHIKADEVKDGTLEEIILDMRKKPFRAEQNGGPAGTEHMRKSFRTVNGREFRLDDSNQKSKAINYRKS